MAKNSGPSYVYRVTRLDPADGPKRLDGSDGAVVFDHANTLPGMLWEGFGLVGTYDCEAAERVLLTMFERLEWEAATYRLEVFTAYRFDPDTSKPFVTVTRELPLHPAYAALEYNPRPGEGPARVYVMKTLADAYPGASLGLLAQHLGQFHGHYRAEIGTAELTERTGWTPPQNWRRPLSHYSVYPTLAALPDELR